MVNDRSIGYIYILYMYIYILYYIYLCYIIYMLYHIYSDWFFRKNPLNNLLLNLGSFPHFFWILEKQRTHIFQNLTDTVDGRNPAPPWMCKTPVNNGMCSISTGAEFLNHQQYLSISYFDFQIWGIHKHGSCPQGNLSIGIISPRKISLKNFSQVVNIQHFSVAFVQIWLIWFPWFSMVR